MSEPKFDVHVQLTGTDGNAYALMARVSSALKDAFRNGELPECKSRDDLELDKFFEEATSDDYDHLLRTCAAWVHVS